MNANNEMLTVKLYPKGLETQALEGHQWVYNIGLGWFGYIKQWFFVSGCQLLNCGSHLELIKHVMAAF